MAEFLEKIQGLQGKSTQEISSLLAKEITNLNSASVFNALTGISVSQSDLDPIGSGSLKKEVAALEKFLEKTPLSISKERVDSLTCDFANEDLYIKIFQEISKGKTLSEDAKVLIEAATKHKDIDVIGEILKRERAAGRNLSSFKDREKRAKSLFEKADQEGLALSANLAKDSQIESIKEEIFDNIPSLFLGNVSKIFEKKYSLRIGPFTLDLKIIKEPGGTANVYLDNNLDYETALKRATEEAKKLQEDKVPCEEPKCEENESVTETEGSIKKKTELLKTLASQVGKIPPVNLGTGQGKNFIKTSLSPADVLGAVHNGYLEELKIKSDTKKKLDLLDKTGGVLPEDFVCPPGYSPLDPATSANLFSQKDLEELKKTLCEPEPGNPIADELLSAPPDEIRTLEDLQKAIGASDDKAKAVSNCIEQLKTQTAALTQKTNDLARYKIAEQKLEELLLYYEVFVSFYEGVASRVNAQASDEISPKDLDSLASLIATGGTLAPYSNRLRQFSVLLEGSKFSALSGNFEFQLFLDSGLGESLPKTKPTLDINGLFSTKEQVDTGGLKLGHEFASGGIFEGKPSNFLTPLSRTLKFTRESPSGSDLYGSIGLITNTSRAKADIISHIRTTNGALYSELIERSASPWLFFTAEERGDNDSRTPDRLEAASYDEAGDPSVRYQDFYSNYDVYWNRRYEEISNNVIAPLLAQIKADSYARGVELGGIIGGGFFTKRLTELRSRRTEISSLLLYTAEQITATQRDLSPEGVASQFSGVACQNSAPAAPDVPEGNKAPSKKKRECPPKCCGPAGSSIKKKKFNRDNLCIADCPGTTDKCYWKEFCKNATRLGLYPIPSGLPPVESASLIGGGTLGLRYWPVGYLPPSFIPLPPPIVNPLDGTPFIRIPLPMIWTKIDPIILPTPLGTIVIFIPFIGGFMPTPLVFFQARNGVSLFLLGLRGFRFIPRTSDPKVKDPLALLKAFLTYGVPLPLLPFLINGLSAPDGDSIKDLILEFRANILELFDRIPEPDPEDFDPVTKIQDKVAQEKAENEDSNKRKRRRQAIEDAKESARNFDPALIEEKKQAIKKSSLDYVEKKLPAPKDLRFPKSSNNLSFTIPLIVKNIIELASLRGSLIPTLPVTTYNLRAEIERVTSIVDIPDNPLFAELNQNYTGDNKIFSIIPGAGENLQPQIEEVNAGIRECVQKILKGDGVSLDKVKRNGVLDPANLGRVTPQLNLPSVPGGQLEIGCIKLNSEGLDGISQGVSANLPSVDENLLNKFALPSNLPGQRIIRKKDLKVMLKSRLAASMDKLEPLISNVPNPGAISLAPIKTLYHTILGALEAPSGLPPKVTGGIPQIIVSGRIIKDIIISQLDTLIEGLFAASLADLLNPNLDAFQNFTPAGLKQALRDLIFGFLDPDNSPVNLNYIKLPSKQTRDQDYSEVLMSSVITSLQKELITQLWLNYDGVPKIPIVKPETISEISDKIQELLSKLPPVAVALLGRNIINILNPLIMRDDFPHWKMMSLRNAYFTIYLDEFLRSAADISGAFKFFVGTGQKGLLYPLPGLDINLGFPINTPFNI